MGFQKSFPDVIARGKFFNKHRGGLMTVRNFNPSLRGSSQ
ncbi:hypothetical protein CLV99_3959 [Sphingobacterium yanglingense]|uniref:Uncharacterized protein n=1 Tax=Sphingobacterium yanglingense TaxID=1437280 RepID=A0A4R6WIQ6_9SPHI|nr:hypothetical protein CLV99_3959 [Sphingobacterium yanglingense]